MSVHKIPVDKLSPEALRGVIEEIISREGTDYGEKEVPMEKKFSYVKQKLESGSAVLIFDDETGTTSICLVDDPVLKKLTHA
ncbi:MAG: YheU family protein [Syntrophales bacterium]|nr:YheU family protein [Syntrophales bacterium]